MMGNNHRSFVSPLLTSSTAHNQWDIFFPRYKIYCHSSSYIVKNKLHSIDYRQRQIQANKKPSFHFVKVSFQMFFCCCCCCCNISLCLSWMFFILVLHYQTLFFLSINLTPTGGKGSGLEIIFFIQNGVNSHILMRHPCIFCLWLLSVSGTEF